MLYSQACQLQPSKRLNQDASLYTSRQIFLVTLFEEISLCDRVFDAQCNGDRHLYPIKRFYSIVNRRLVSSSAKFKRYEDGFDPCCESAEVPNKGP